MKSLNHALSEQQQWMETQSELAIKRTAGETFYLHFELGESQFALPLKDVQEVSEFHAITPYPIEVGGTSRSR